MKIITEKQTALGHGGRIRRFCICVRCKKKKEHHARGLCVKCYAEEWFSKNKNYKKEWRANNREKFEARRREWRKKHMEEERQYAKRRYVQNKKAILKRQKEQRKTPDGKLKSYVGRLTRLKNKKLGICSDCKKRNKTEFHHISYSPNVFIEVCKK